MSGTLLRLAAFAVDGRGGNPAGVWLGDALPDVGEMQRIAARVGYSETAFNARDDDRTWTTRYYSPEAEVSFCGHATIATGVALGGLVGPGPFRLRTAVGPVVVDVAGTQDAGFRATLTSVTPQRRPLSDALLVAVLDVFGWSTADLDEAIPPGRMFAGAWHVIVPLASRRRLAAMTYDYGRLRDVMLVHGLTTIQLLHRESATVFHARNPFPVGGVVEDPATGAAAAAFGAHLRDLGLAPPSGVLTIHQGHDMGRPSLLTVTIPPRGGIKVTGTAAAIAEESADGATPEDRGDPDRHGRT